MTDSREYPLGASRWTIPMRPCPDCNYPAAYDAFGNTDHVCATGPVAARLASLFPKVDSPRVVVIESTAAGTGSAFYERWQRGQQ